MIETLQHFKKAGLLFWLVACGLGTAQAAVPQQLNHQGRVAVNGVNFDGNGQFKFALVNAGGTVSYWSNDGTGTAGSQPTAAVTLAVTKGLYSVLLGDSSLANMTALTTSALDQDDVRLRIWFNDGSRGFQLITPDQRLAAAPYALLAAKATSATGFEGSLAGDVTGTQGTTSITATTVTGKTLTNYGSTTGTISAADTILTAIGKLNGNNAAKAPIESPTFTGTVSGISASMVGLGNVSNTSDANKPVSTAQQTALALKADATALDAKADLSALDAKAPLASPTFTGTVSGISAGMVGLGNVSNTNDANKPVSTAQQTALALKADLTALDAKAPLASPTFTGTVSGISAGMVGLGNVSNTSDASKPVSTAQQTALALKADATALDAKAPLASPTFTGTVSGISAGMVGLGNVSNTSDANKPVSTAQQTALALKANLASPSFTGTVALPAGTASVAPLKLTTGTNLSTAVLGSVEFDGINLYLTTNASSPTRKTVALSDTGSSSQMALANVVAAPVKPVVAWGNNGNGQTTLPSLSGVAAIAAGESHSLALLDAGTLVAWGLNTSGQTTIPGTATGVTDIAAGVDHNLARKSDGTIVAWGSNASGKATVPSGITTATKVAAGASHSLGLLANGTLRAWGDNYWGQTTIPSALAGGSVTAIASGYDHNLALTTAGAVVAWGRGSEEGGAGQISVPAAAATGVVAIAAGAYHSLALKSNGTVVAWGLNAANQCTVPADLSGVTQLAAGYGFSVALKSNGAIVVWGEAADGVPTIPATATEVVAIAAGARHALALRADLISAQVARLDQDNVFSGKVGIKRTPAVNALEVEGTASKTTASSWLANSDRRIKTEIETITGALEKLDQVRLVDFRYTDAYRAAHPSIENVRYPNVIAQEFAEVFPDGVKSSGELMPDGSPILQVDTYPLTIYSAAAVQELHRENLALKKQVNDQEQRLRRLEQILKDK